MGEPTEGKVEQYLRLLKAGISDPGLSLSPERILSKPALAGPSPTPTFAPTPGYYGQPGAHLPTAEESLRIYRELGWIPAVAGPFENDRLAVLERYNLSKAVEAQAAVDRITDLASTVFNVPICVVSLVQEDQELFVSTLGWDQVSFDFGRPACFLRCAERSRRVLCEGFDAFSAGGIAPSSRESAPSRRSRLIDEAMRRRRLSSIQWRENFVRADPPSPLPARMNAPRGSAASRSLWQVRSALTAWWYWRRTTINRHVSSYPTPPPTGGSRTT